MLPAGDQDEAELIIQVTSRQHRRCFTSQALKHSLALLGMGEITARNMLS